MKNYLYKLLLRLAELISLLLGSAALLLALLLRFDLIPIAPSLLLPPPLLFALFVLTLFIFLLAILLITGQKAPTITGLSLLRTGGLTPQQLTSLARHCPRPLLIVALPQVVMAIIIMASVGKQSGGLDSPLSSQAAIGFCSFMALFNLLACPFIASARRKPTDTQK